MIATQLRQGVRTLTGPARRPASARGRYKVLTRSAIAGVFAFVIIVGAGAAAVHESTPKWTAQTSLVLLPNKDIDPSEAAGYFDTLSRGQITSTAGEILGLNRFKVGAASELHLTRAQTTATSVKASVVTGSSIVNVSVSASSASISERMADTLVSQATDTVNALIAPYQLSVVSKAGDSATLTGSLSSTKFLLVLVVVALALGVGTQQAVYQIGSLWGARVTSPRRQRAASSVIRGQPAGRAADTSVPDSLPQPPRNGKNDTGAVKQPKPREPGPDLGVGRGRRTKATHPPQQQVAPAVRSPQGEGPTGRDRVPSPARRAAEG